MKLYLETLKPIVNEKQHEHVKKLVADFTNGPGVMLQEILIERREELDSWVRMCVYQCRPDICNDLYRYTTQTKRKKENEKIQV